MHTQRMRCLQRLTHHIYHHPQQHSHSDQHNRAITTCIQRRKHIINNRLTHVSLSSTCTCSSSSLLLFSSPFPFVIPCRGTLTTVDMLRVGDVIEYEHGLYQLLSTSTHMRGRAHTTISLELKDIGSGKSKPIRLRPADKVEVVDSEINSLQYLYHSDTHLHLMDPSTYDQVEISINVLSPVELSLLAENTLVRAHRTKGEYRKIDLPTKVDCVVASVTGAPPQGSDSTQQTIELSNGLKIRAPNYVEVGDIVTIRTDNMTFVDRKGKESKWNK